MEGGRRTKRTGIGKGHILQILLQINCWRIELGRGIGGMQKYGRKIEDKK
jgi:hypothetical protein